MNSQPHDTPRPDRIRDLAQKLRRLADDPSATAAEKAAAADRLRSMLKKHGLTEADIDSEEQVDCRLYIAHHGDHPVAIAVICQVLDTTSVMASSIPSWVGIRCTPAQRADILEAWSHYAVPLAEARKVATAERQRMIREAKRLETGLATAFIAKFRIFADSPQTGCRKLTPDQIAAARAAHSAISGIDGERWQKRAGRIAAGTHQLAAG